MLQLIVDMRQRNVLPKWKSAVIIHDKYTGDDTLTAVLQGFSSHTNLSDVATAIFTIDSHSRLKSLYVSIFLSLLVILYLFNCYIFINYLFSILSHNL